MCKYFSTDWMESKNVTLKIDAPPYKKFRKYCKKKGLIISR